MAVYAKDSPELFTKSLKSVYSNTLRPQDVLLVIDGPISLAINKIIQYYVDAEAMRTLYLVKNVGLAKALNEGLNLIESEWIIRADADDINLPTRFEVLANHMSLELDLIGSQILEINENGSSDLVRNVPLKSCQIRLFAKKRNPFNHMTVAYRTAFVKKCGGYPDIYLKEDYGLWAKMISQGAKVMNIDQILVWVNTGYDFYKRRGGLRYVKAEIELQKYLIKCNINNILEGLFIGFMRSFIYILPNFLRYFFYKIVLRSFNN
jgi:glycosyltransferase involved in cell wall biosynthesis